KSRLDALDADQIHADAGDGAGRHGWRWGGRIRHGIRVARGCGAPIAPYPGSYATPPRRRTALAAPLRLQARLHHQGFHVAHGLFPAVEHGLGNDGVADIELGNAIERGNGPDVAVVQAVAGVDPHAVAQAFGHGRAQALQFGFALGLAGLGVGAGVQFDDRRANLRRGLDLGDIRVDEQRHPDTGIVQARHRVAHGALRAPHIEAAFGGELGALFGHQADILRTHGAGDLQHFVGDRAFEVHAGAQYRPD